MVSSANGSEESLIMCKQEWLWRRDYATLVLVCGSGQPVIIENFPWLWGLNHMQLLLNIGTRV